MQQVQKKELPERISWARSIIFAAGFFFLAAILVGQLPGYIYLKMTAASLEGLQQGLFSLAVTCLAGFIIVFTVVSLFDPKPSIPPAVFTGLGAILSVAGLALSLWSYFNGQYFPNFAKPEMYISPMLGGQFLWFQANAIDLLMVGLAVFTVGLAMIFYAALAVRESRTEDRRDLGTTPAIRSLIIAGSTLVVLSLLAYSQVSDQGLALQIVGGNMKEIATGIKWVNLGAGIILGTAIYLTMAAFALRLHYLMRPVRQRTMPALYAVGALGLGQTGGICLVLAVALYPLIGGLHFVPILGPYFTLCARQSAIPATCTFAQQGGYLVDAIVTTNAFVILMGAVWAWKSNRNLVVVGSVVTVATIAGLTLLVHTAPDQILVSMIFCAGMLIMAVIWTSVGRREFAVVGENNLGCLGQWLVMGTCLFIYLGAFAFFSIAPASWEPETAPNIPFIPGTVIAPPSINPTAPVMPQTDAVVMIILMGVLAAVQLYFLTRNRYKV
ncbi:hypothetical protein [Ktedonobacter racemifer]|uniref:Uncharacterized protein n=1 Tax=Ktedonobacter racemifer DSM 44963 TaxID=485913 RepID=D6TNQ6_KTERA|nr:hypothetical protein [Ktedonobacter racemifer]EFH85442.1 hypothetical protein Krac_6663 [Ktedonobacter racemifer DSM 44963]